MNPCSQAELAESHIRGCALLLAPQQSVMLRSFGAAADIYVDLATQHTAIRDQNNLFHQQITGGAGGNGNYTYNREPGMARG